MKLDGYSWLCPERECIIYDFPARARKDSKLWGSQLPLEMIGYFPKEVFAENSWTPAIDIYALGMTIIHFLTNTEPYLLGEGLI